MKERALRADAAALAERAADGVVVARSEGAAARSCARSRGLVRHRAGATAVVLGGRDAGRHGGHRRGDGRVGRRGRAGARWRAAHRRRWRRKRRARARRGRATPGGLDEALDAVRAQLGARVTPRRAAAAASSRSTPAPRGSAWP